ncbi:hypothetical protein E8E14_009702 [Neopestalotiopsis sp. 37M]|nr:hypothetical protein E8E14_009702 [Neopestalotiopsis sp. 37M]
MPAPRGVLDFHPLLKHVGGYTQLSSKKSSGLLDVLAHSQHQPLSVIEETNFSMGSQTITYEKVAIITGSTSGIGLDLAKHLHGRGYRVAVTGRRATLGEQVAKELDPSAETVIFVQSAVESYASQTNLFRTVWKKWGRIDVLIANAGIVDKGSVYNFGHRSADIDDIPDAPDLSCTEIDWKGVVYGTTLAIHFMRHNEKPGGKIIITNSMMAIHPGATFPEYCGAKAAALQWARTMAPLLKSKENITINTVLPGAVDTPIKPGFSLAFLPEHLTLPSCLISAYDLYLDDEANERTGEAIETAHDKHFFYEVPEYKGGDVSFRNTLVFEPWFSGIHGEPSGLKDALIDSPRASRM